MQDTCLGYLNGGKTIMMGGTANLKPMMGVLLAFAAIYFVVMIANTVHDKIKKKKREKERMEEKNEL